MRMMQKNKRKFQYRNLIRAPDPATDPQGLYTGEPAREFGERLTGYANIAPATGAVNEMGFGANLEYDRVLCAETDFGMTEHSVLWVDDLESESPDYVVRRIARSLNHVRIALAKVNVQ